MKTLYVSKNAYVSSISNYLIIKFKIKGFVILSKFFWNRSIL